jgi:PPOX class probable F420-dependent enzyme
MTTAASTGGRWVHEQEGPPRRRATNLAGADAWHDVMRCFRRAATGPHIMGSMTTMTRSDAIEFLSTGTRTGKLATSSPSGRPHVAPIWFVVDGDDLVFNTGAESAKGRNLRSNPQASLAVDVDVFPYSFVIVRGTVSIDEHATDLLAWSTAIAARYVPDGKAEAFGERNAVDGELLVRLHIDRIIGERDIAAG